MSPLSPEALAGVSQAVKQINAAANGDGDEAVAMLLLMQTAATKTQSDTLQALLAELKALRADRLAELSAPIQGTVQNAHGTDPLTPPPIGALWAAQGGLYAGLCRGVDGKPDHHLILAHVSPDANLTWQAALDWAAQLRHRAFDDWTLPTRAESAVLFGNLKAEFAPRWHWTSEQRSAGGAWLQTFVDGGQSNYDKGFEGRARAVRRLVIQSFTD